MSEAMETTETIEVGDLVRVITETTHFNEIPPVGAIGRVAPPYWNGMAKDLRIVRYTCEANPVGDYEADYTLKVDELELVDVAALNSDTPASVRNDWLARQHMMDVWSAPGTPDVAERLEAAEKRIAELERVKAALETIASYSADPMEWPEIVAGLEDEANRLQALALLASGVSQQEVDEIQGKAGKP